MGTDPWAWTGGIAVGVFALIVLHANLCRRRLRELYWEMKNDPDKARLVIWNDSFLPRLDLRPRDNCTVHVEQSSEYIRGVGIVQLELYRPCKTKPATT